jgi:actin related protein 2/3 complex subunit 5
MSQIDFRRIDVDQYDPDSFISKEDLTPPCKPVSAAEQQQVATEIRGAISRGEAKAALPIALDFAPYGGDDKVKVSMERWKRLLLAASETPISS